MINRCVSFKTGDKTPRLADRNVREQLEHTEPIVEQPQVVISHFQVKVSHQLQD